MKPKRPSLAEYVNGQTLADRLARDKDAAHRRADIAELRRLTSVENHRQDALQIIRDMSVMISPPKYHPVAAAPKRAPRHTAALVTSDWQLGQLSKLSASGGMYEQTSAVTKRQVRQMWERFLLCHRIEAAGKNYDELVLWNLGDMCDGDQLRVSQAVEVDAPVTQQALDVLDLEAWLIEQALTVFPKVRVLRVGGNHDRTSAKAGLAGLGELGFTDTYSWLIGGFIQRLFTKSIDQGRLDIVNHESFFGTAKVVGLRAVYEHGSSFKASTGSYGGISFYSIANAARGYKEMLEGADLVLFAHHHRAMILPLNGGWGAHIMNGALPPTSNFIQTLKGYGRPQQWMLDFHESVGVAGYRPLYLEQPEHMRPGQFWNKQKDA